MLIIDPDPVLKSKWGPLAHVNEFERDRILNLPFGQFKPAIKLLEKQIKEFEKKRKSIEAEKRAKKIYFEEKA